MPWYVHHTRRILCVPGVRNMDFTLLDFHTSATMKPHSDQTHFHIKEQTSPVNFLQKILVEESQHIHPASQIWNIKINKVILIFQSFLV